MKSSALLFFVIFMAAQFAAIRPAHAWTSGTEKFALTSYYSYYAKLGLGATDDSLNLNPSIDIEGAFRINTIFSFTLVVSKFSDPDPAATDTHQGRVLAAGAGLKVDLPGIFFLGAERFDTVRETKSKPVNTFIFGEILKFDSTDVTTGLKISGTAPKYGAGIDVFLFNPVVYLSARYMFFNFIGDSYHGGSAGLGMSF